ncbi:MAG: CoA ester lyase [Chloroflexi bacterium]|nr:CoA ester lyase [Chloroflexota bacterium]MYK61861.1 CoA ester lyase [Chloroflexota bacterium]
MPPAQFSHIDLRCPLFIPGNRRDMLGKAGRYSPSAYIPDMEDSVPTANKEEARAITGEALPYLFELGKAVVPRVNSLETGLTEGDLEAVVGRHIVGISIGKVRSAGDIALVDGMLSELEVDRGIKVGTVGILPWLERASAIVNAFEICNASERVRWVAFGAEDYSADMGISRAVDVEGGNMGTVDEYGEASLLYARSTVAVAARAADVQALDTPYVKFRDPDGLRSEAGLARRLGYSGKFAIHPAQVEVIEEIFSPTDAEIERARRVLEVARVAELEGRGSVSLDGEMVDAPVVARARNVLARANIDLDD